MRKGVTELLFFWGAQDQLANEAESSRVRVNGRAQTPRQPVTASKKPLASICVNTLISNSSEHSARAINTESVAKRAVYRNPRSQRIAAIAAIGT